jgi:hypothetical protein
LSDLYSQKARVQVAFGVSGGRAPRPQPAGFAPGPPPSASPSRDCSASPSLGPRLRLRSARLGFAFGFLRFFGLHCWTCWWGLGCWWGLVRDHRHCGDSPGCLLIVTVPPPERCQTLGVRRMRAGCGVGCSAQLAWFEWGSWAVG